MQPGLPYSLCCAGECFSRPITLCLVGTTNKRKGIMANSFDLAAYGDLTGDELRFMARSAETAERYEGIDRETPPSMTYSF